MNFIKDQEINLLNNEKLQNCFYILEKNNKYLLCHYESFSGSKISVKYGPCDTTEEIIEKYNEEYSKYGKFLKNFIFI